MRIEAITNDPEALYKAINKAITDETVKTWDIVKNDKNEIIYTHSPEQWRETAMLKPTIEKDKLIFTITSWRGHETPAKSVKGYITGRFTELLLVHFSGNFTQLNTYA